MNRIWKTQDGLSAVRLRAGDLIRLPAGDGKFVVAQILFLSKRNRNMAIVRVWAKEAQPGAGLPPEGDPSYVMFVSKVAAVEGRWPKMGHEPVGPDGVDLTRYYMAGDVWSGDDYLGPATAEDRASLPNLALAGDLSVERVATAIRTGEQLQRMPFLVRGKERR